MGGGGEQESVPGSGGHAAAPHTQIPGVVGGGDVNASGGSGGAPPGTPGSGGHGAGPDATSTNTARERQGQQGGTITVNNEVTVRDRRDLDRKIDRLKQDLKRDLEQTLSDSGAGSQGFGR
jgi:hypothetical protein